MIVVAVVVWKTMFAVIVVLACSDDDIGDGDGDGYCDRCCADDDMDGKMHCSHSCRRRLLVV